MSEISTTSNNQLKEVQKEYPLFIGGEFVPARSGKTISIYSPATKKEITQVAEGDQEDIDLAIEAADKAFPKWAETSKEERAQLLERMGSQLKSRLDEIAYLETFQTGRPIREMKSQLARLPEWFTYYASLLRTLEDQMVPYGGPYLSYTRRSPLGIVGQITPWNHPLLILIKKVVPALAAGNTIVVKPSELAPLTALELARMSLEAGLPPGVLNVVPGYGPTAGAALCKDPRVAKLDVTGGTETGKRIAQMAGANLAKISCELGGKASVLVFADVNVDEAVNGCAFASFIATGQTCVQGARILVHESIYSEFVQKLIDKVSSIRLGDPLDLKTQMGPLISERQLQRTIEYVQVGLNEGAKLVYGGNKANIGLEGYYFEPTIFADVENEMQIAQEEIFGPITCILPFKDEKDAIQKANGTDFGLAMAIWTKDVKRAHRIAEKLESGIVWVNDHHRIDPSSPWGGFKMSGIGKENGIACYLDYTQQKTVIVNLNEDSFDWYDSSEIKRYS
jgi:acyl-CoA reductase-like NAD-dependent aldehyde dehydrogenase